MSEKQKTGFAELACRYTVAVPSRGKFHGPFGTWPKARDWAESYYGKTVRWHVLPIIPESRDAPV